MPNGRTRLQTFPLSKKSLNISGYRRHKNKDENQPLIDNNHHGNFQVYPSLVKNAIRTKKLISHIKLKFSGPSKYQHLDFQADTSSSDEEVITTALELIGSKLSTFLTQVNTTMKNGMPTLCNVLGTEALNVMGAALEFKYFYKHNYTSWLETLCTKAVFSAAAQASEKKTTVSEFKSAVNEATNDAIEKYGETLKNWGANNDEIDNITNTVNKYLLDFHANIDIKNKSHDRIHKKYKQELKKLDDQCTQLKTKQLYLNETFPALEHILGTPLDSLTDMLRQNDKANSPLAKYPLTIDENETIDSLNDLLHYAIQVYLLPTSEDDLANRVLYVIIYLLTKGATPKQNSLPHSAPNCPKVWELLHQLLESTITVNSNIFSATLLEHLGQVSALCHEKSTQITTAEDTRDPSRFLSIFKPQHKRASLSPNQVVEIMNPLYNKNFDENMLIEKISEITARRHNMMANHTPHKSHSATL